MRNYGTFHFLIVFFDIPQTRNLRMKYSMVALNTQLWILNASFPNVVSASQVLNSTSCPLNRLRFAACLDYSVSIHSRNIKKATEGLFLRSF